MDAPRAVGKTPVVPCAAAVSLQPACLLGMATAAPALFGATIGHHVHIDPSVRIEIPWNLDIGNWSAVGFDAVLYNLGMVRIGRCATVSHRAHLCAGTHDHRDPSLPLQKPPITIQDDAWVCADAFVGPGVEIGAGAVVGARGVVVRNVAAWVIVAGNPAKEIGKRSGWQLRRCL